MPARRRAIEDQHVGRWTPRARAAAGLAGLAVLAAAGTAAVVFLTGGSPRQHPRPLSTTLASQQLVGLAVPGPRIGSPQRLLAPSALFPHAMSFIAGGRAATVLANGLCLSAAGTRWAIGTPAHLLPCGDSLAWQQLVEFWSAY